MRLILAALIFLSGCCLRTCPPEDVYFPTTSAHGEQGMMAIEKGWLDNRENWLSYEEFDQLYQQYLLEGESATRVD